MQRHTKHTEATKQKIREQQLGRKMKPRTAEHSHKISVAMKKHWALKKQLKEI